MKTYLDPIKYQRVLAMFRRRGMPLKMAKTAAAQSSISGETLPELTSSLGLTWLNENARK
jgi:hypothetical protein